MAIKFEDDKDDRRPAKKLVGGKTYVAEEPSSEPEPDAETALPFAKPAPREKKGPKIRNRPAAPKGKTPAA